MGMSIVVVARAHIAEQEQWFFVPNAQWTIHHCRIIIDFPGHTKMVLGKKRLFKDRAGQTIQEWEGLWTLQQQRQQQQQQEQEQHQQSQDQASKSSSVKNQRH